MDDLHALNEAINQKAGRKLLPSIAVSLAILAVVFLSVYFVPIAFALLVWVAVMLALRELVAAYKTGGIELPEVALQIAGTALLIALTTGAISA